MSVVQKRNRLSQKGVSLNAFDSTFTSSDLEFFQKNIFEKCGIFLEESKSFLVQSRLRKRLIDLGLNNYSEYCDLLSDQESEADEWQLVINNLTTHTTEWFRENDHFKELREKIVPQWISKKMARPLRVWSAACSTGEEAYSIALVLNYFKQRSSFDYEITATDIDTEVLSHATEGLYSVGDLEKIPQEYHSEALARGINSSKNLMKVRDHIKNKINFSHFNLVNYPYRFNSQFDLIFCRNILIYFSPKVIEKVVGEMYKVASPGAILFTGHSESLSDLTVPWKFVNPTHYEKSGGE
jgi:chemotaxis methyl-accepting protein methylase